MTASRATETTDGQESKMQTKSKVAIILGLMTAATIVGFLIGRWKSPDSNSPGVAEQFLAMYGKWEKMDEQRGRITLRAGNRTYTYATGDTVVTVRYLSALQLASSPMPHRDFDSDFEKLLAL